MTGALAQYVQVAMDVLHPELTGFAHHPVKYQEIIIQLKICQGLS